MIPQAGSGQRQGETWLEFFHRRTEEDQEVISTETLRQRIARLQRLSHSSSLADSHTADVFRWLTNHDGFLVRYRVHPFNIPTAWKRYTKSQCRYNDVRNQFDLNYDFAPAETVWNILKERQSPTDSLPIHRDDQLHCQATEEEPQGTIIVF